MELVFKYMFTMVLLSAMMIMGPFDWLVKKFIGEDEDDETYDKDKLS